MTLLLFYICFFQQLQSFSDHHIPGHLCDLPIHNISHHFWASSNQLWIWKQKCGQICVKLVNQRTIGLTMSWLYLIDISIANLLHFLALDHKGVIFKKKYMMNNLRLFWQNCLFIILIFCCQKGGYAMLSFVCCIWTSLHWHWELVRVINASPEL